MDIYPSSTLPAGSFATFEVYLAVPAPPGGALVTITNGNPAVTTLPPSITIGAGAHYGNTNLTVSSSASSGAMDQITVMYGGDSKQITLTVQ
jgi:hypothetical protein